GSNAQAIRRQREQELQENTAEVIPVRHPVEGQETHGQGSPSINRKKSLLAEAGKRQVTTRKAKGVRPDRGCGCDLLAQDPPDKLWTHTFRCSGLIQYC